MDTILPILDLNSDIQVYPYKQPLKDLKDNLIIWRFIKNKVDGTIIATGRLDISKSFNNTDSYGRETGGIINRKTTIDVYEHETFKNLIIYLYKYEDGYDSTFDEIKISVYDINTDEFISYGTIHSYIVDYAYRNFIIAKKLSLEEFIDETVENYIEKNHKQYSLDI